MSSKPSFLRDDRGASAVELALVLPVFATMFFGAVQLGFGLHCASSVRWALESSARGLVLNRDLTRDQLRAGMLEKLSIPGQDSVVVELTKDEPGAAGTTQFAHASSTYKYPLAIPFVPTQELTFKADVNVPLTEEEADDDAAAT